MYPPKHHQKTNFEDLLKVVQQFPLATLISANGEDCLTTHIPLLHEQDGSRYGKLIGHLDKSNPQCNFLSDRKTHIIFNGPNCYISPTTYTTKQLPTWNYMKVHMEGIARIITDTTIVKQSLVDLTNFMEAAEEKPFILDYNDPRMEQLIPYITGIEIAITKVEGKFKLSQDKSPVDKMRAREKLICYNQRNLQAFVASFV